VTLSLRDAISGKFAIESTGIDGEPIVYPITRIVQPGEELRVSGRGMNQKDRARGDHVFVVKVLIPNLTLEQRRKLMEVL